MGTDRIVVSEVLASRGNRLHVAALGGAIAATALPVVILDEKVLDEARVTWTGGPDLVVPLFIPPYLELAGGRTIYVMEQTANVGTVPAGPSTTRYFLSSVEPPIDPGTAQMIGERAVPALDPEATDTVQRLPLALPANLPAGAYHLAACADAGQVIAELEEDNNCSFSRLATGQVFVMPMKQANRPPECSSARANPDLLWPPNHKLVTVAVSNINDPDGDGVAIRVERITQDEPVNGLGDGDTSPDGFGVGASEVRLRAERSGVGNGRVYRVSFTAEDGQGGNCQGTVTVGVPHDQGQGAVPIDDGQKYDSTLP